MAGFSDCLLVAVRGGVVVGLVVVSAANKVIDCYKNKKAQISHVLLVTTSYLNICYQSFIAESKSRQVEETSPVILL